MFSPLNCMIGQFTIKIKLTSNNTKLYSETEHYAIGGVLDNTIYYISVTFMIQLFKTSY